MTFRKISIGFVAAIALTATLPVFAAKITPAGPFSAGGRALFEKNWIGLECSAVLTGTVNADGTASVAAARFTGAPMCYYVYATNLPWQMEASAVDKVTISGFSVSTLLGSCGPGTVPADWANDTGTLSYTDAVVSADCSIRGEFPTLPALTIR